MLHQISDLFEFVTCPYRWYQKRVLLMDHDNIYTISGKLSDIKASPRQLRKNGNDEFEAFNLHIGDGKCLYGVCDSIIFIKNTNGVYVPKVSTDETMLFSVVPMEYKQKEHQGRLQQASQIQCVAQARCLEIMLNCNVGFYYIYYKQERRRKQYLITSDDRHNLSDIINQMDYYLSNGIVPSRSFNKNSCPKCSSYEYCLPNGLSTRLDFISYLQKEGK